MGECTVTPPDPATAAAVGEVRGQLRELIHSVNDLGQRNEANSRILVKLEDMPSRLTKIEDRLTTLETTEHRREGERGVLHAVLRSPTIAWLIAGAIGLWVAFKERLHL